MEGSELFWKVTRVQTLWLERQNYNLNIEILKKKYEFPRQKYTELDMKVCC